MELETLRKNMIQAFNAWQTIPTQSSYARQKVWEEYVAAREAFLKLDCEKKCIRYVPLKETIITVEHYNYPL